MPRTPGPGVTPDLASVSLQKARLRLGAILAWRLAAATFFFSAAGPILRASAESAQLPGIGAAMEVARANAEISGAVTLVAMENAIVHLEATGFSDLGRQQRMTPDQIFWIASMTKPITGVAILMLQDEGKLTVDDEVEKFLPEFAKLRTPVGRPAHLTLRQMLTHTSGLSDAPVTASLAAEKLSDLIPYYLRAPLQFEPGTKWKYCQAGIDTAARIVELVSGETFDRFLAARLFDPLGMKDTTFYLTESQVARLATAYAKNKATGQLEPVKVRIFGDRPLTSRNRPPLGSGGLFSTATDYARFCQMLLNEGQLEGRRILKKESVQLMHTIQTDGVEGVFPPVKGYGWGLSCGIIREPQGVTAMFSPGTFGHSGAYGTHAWIDPRRGAIFVLMVQRANFSTTDDNVVRRTFQQAAVDAFDARR